MALLAVGGGGAVGVGGRAVSDYDDDTSRVWYDDGTFIDVPAGHAWEYEDDPGWVRTEPLSLAGLPEVPQS